MLYCSPTAKNELGETAKGEKIEIRSQGGKYRESQPGGLEIGRMRSFSSNRSVVFSVVIFDRRIQDKENLYDMSEESTIVKNLARKGEAGSDGHSGEEGDRHVGFGSRVEERIWPPDWRCGWARYRILSSRH